MGAAPVAEIPAPSVETAQSAPQQIETPEQEAAPKQSVVLAEAAKTTTLSELFHNFGSIDSANVEQRINDGSFGESLNEPHTDMLQPNSETDAHDTTTGTTSTADGSTTSRPDLHTLNNMTAEQVREAIQEHPDIANTNLLRTSPVLREAINARKREQKVQSGSSDTADKEELPTSEVVESTNQSALSVAENIATEQSSPSSENSTAIADTPQAINGGETNTNTTTLSGAETVAKYIKKIANIETASPEQAKGIVEENLDLVSWSREAINQIPNQNVQQAILDAQQANMPRAALSDRPTRPSIEEAARIQQYANTPLTEIPTTETVGLSQDRAQDLLKIINAQQDQEQLESSGGAVHAATLARQNTEAQQNRFQRTEQRLAEAQSRANPQTQLLEAQQQLDTVRQEYATLQENLQRVGENAMAKKIAEYELSQKAKALEQANTLFEQAKQRAGSLPNNETVTRQQNQNGISTETPDLNNSNVTSEKLSPQNGPNDNSEPSHETTDEHNAEGTGQEKEITSEDEVSHPTEESGNILENGSQGTDEEGTKNTESIQGQEESEGRQNKGPTNQEKKELTTEEKLREALKRIENLEKKMTEFADLSEAAAAFMPLLSQLAERFGVSNKDEKGKTLSKWKFIAVILTAIIKTIFATTNEK